MLFVVLDSKAKEKIESEKLSSLKLNKTLIKKIMENFLQKKNCNQNTVEGIEL
jgi:hypothetical protein